jgi:hypothetical protein
MFLCCSGHIGGEEFRGTDFLWFFLGYLPVLTVETSEVASRCGYGKDRGSWIKMEHGLLLDWINVDGTRIAIGQGV